jgi:hypothetical protein
LLRAATTAVPLPSDTIVSGTAVPFPVVNMLCVIIFYHN